jgi:glycosyltransferase involved in cell wall biosynthesis
VTVTTATEPPLHGYSLVHGSGMTLPQVRRCREAGLVVCLSTIYWSQRYTMGLDQRMGAGRQVARRVRLALSLAADAARLRHVEKSEDLLRRQLGARMLYESADVLLPNSAMEADTIRAELGVTTPMVVVPNGIDEAIFSQPSPPWEARSETVLYVGRFEPHKNQLGLIHALHDRPYELVLVGPPHPHHQEYRRECMRVAGPRVRFVSETSQEALVDLYGGARVHVLPSWYETTGLVSLEAAALGCNVVTTDRGFASEYFGPLARYCDPADPRTIAAAVDGALRTPPDPALRKRVLDRFTWRDAGQATLAAYRQALDRRRAGGEAPR